MAFRSFRYSATNLACLGRSTPEAAERGAEGGPPARLPSDPAPPVFPTIVGCHSSGENVPVLYTPSRSQVCAVCLLTPAEAAALATVQP